MVVLRRGAGGGNQQMFHWSSRSSWQQRDSKDMRLRWFRQSYWLISQLCLVLRCSLALTSRGTVEFPLTELDFSWMSSFSACSPDSGDHVRGKILLSQVCGGVCNYRGAHVKPRRWRRKIWRHHFRPPLFGWCRAVSLGCNLKVLIKVWPNRRQLWLCFPRVQANCRCVKVALRGVWVRPPSGPTLTKLQGTNTVMMQPFIPSSWPAGLLVGLAGAGGGDPL